MHVGVPTTSDGRRPVAILAQGVGAFFGSRLDPFRLKVGANLEPCAQNGNNIFRPCSKLLAYSGSHFGSRLEGMLGLWL